MDRDGWIVLTGIVSGCQHTYKRTYNTKNENLPAIIPFKKCKKCITCSPADEQNNKDSWTHYYSLMHDFLVLLPPLVLWCVPL